MALGGGIWTTQNKVLPGAYISFASVSRASATLSDRGVAAMPLILDWGPVGTVFTVTNEDFQKQSRKIFGYSYDADELLPLRELFHGTKTLHAWRLVSGATKAACAYAAAKYVGKRGNDLMLTVAASVDDESLREVCTYLGNALVDKQTVPSAAELANNDYVDFKKDAELAETAGAPLTGGTNGMPPEGSAHQAFLDVIESFSFNALGCPTDIPAIVSLYAAFTKRMRDEIGAKFQLVAYRPSTADYEGVIAVKNSATGYKEGTPGLGEFGLVYWTTGVAAGCEVSKSNTNKRYNGELTVDTAYTQAQLTEAVKTGEFIFHSVGTEVRVLEDINSLVTFTDTKGQVFQSNQTVRVCDQIANDVAVLFNTRYLGIIPNDASGRISLWNDICKLHQALESIRAIEGFDPKTVTVEQGDTKKAVVCNITGLNVINAMAQLYMSVIIE